MRVPDEVRDCVVFTQAYRRGATIPRTFGSAFLVVVNVTDDRGYVFAVTAKHLLGDRDGLGDEVQLTFNTASGRRAVSTDPDKWLIHPAADVAAYRLDGLDGQGFQFRMAPMEMFATEAWSAERNIGTGDDVFITGLLAHHPGTERNMPIVRIGNIAALPTEPIALDYGIAKGEDTVTLIEARSIGGISGSPVFVHLSFFRDIPAGSMLFADQEIKASSGGTFSLLGLVHGYYNVGSADHDGLSAGDENLNTGIAVVVRADRILDLIDSPAQREVRAMAKKIIEEQSRPTPAGADAPDQSEFERFADLTKQLVNTPKSDAQNKDEGAA